MSAAYDKTPAWLLERLAQGELDATHADAIRARLSAEGRSWEAELGALAQSNRDILAAQPKAVFAAAIRQRVRSAAPVTATRMPWRLLAPLALTGALAATLVLGRTGPAPMSTNDSDGEVTQIKGDPSNQPRLLVYRQRAGQASAGDEAERLRDGARAARGDLLQLAYAAPDRTLYGVVISMDGAGHVTQHLPDEGTASAAPLRATPEMRLPSAYQLDDAPAFERFVLVTASRTFPVAVVTRAAANLAGHGARARSGSLELPAGFHQAWFLLDKASKGTP